MDLLIPPASPVRFVGIGPQDSVLFEGRFRLTGRYHCGRARRTAVGAELELHFFPDEALRTVLPYWHEHRPVLDLRMDNADEFLRAVVREPVLCGLREGQVPAVSGRAVIWGDGYHVSLQDRRPLYTLHFLSLDGHLPADSCLETADLAC